MSAQTPSGEPKKAFAESAHLVTEWLKLLLPPSAAYWFTQSLEIATWTLFVVLTIKLIWASLSTASRFLRISADGVDKFRAKCGAMLSSGRNWINEKLRRILARMLKSLRHGKK